MVTGNIDPRLIQIGIELAPTFIVLLRSWFTKAHPGDPVPSDAELMAAAEATFNAEHARNIEILRSHPANPNPIS